MGELDTLTASALAQIRDAGSVPALEEIRVHWLGKKGTLTEQLKTLGALPAPERPAAGARINTAKSAVQAAIEARRAELEQRRRSSAAVGRRHRRHLPGRGERLGGLHPITPRGCASSRFSVAPALRWPTGRRSRTSSTISKR